MLQNDVIKSCLIATSQQRGEIVSRRHFRSISRDLRYRSGEKVGGVGGYIWKSGQEV